MGYPGKLMNLSALLAKLEATYGTAVAVTATADGQLLALSDRYPGIFTAEYAYDGALGPSPGNLGMLKRARAAGRSATGTVPMRAKGAAATYAATVLPNIHTMLRISGFDSTLNTGTYTYTPTADSVTYGSASMEAYKRGEKWSLDGVIASCGFDITGPSVPVWSFDCKGRLTTIADGAMVAPTYPTLTTQEPLSLGSTVTIGTFITPVVKGASFKMNRDINTVRLNLTDSNGLAGFVPGGYDPEYRVTLESTALTSPTASGGFDPYELLNDAEEVAIAHTVGTVALNRYTVNGPQAQLKSFTLGNDGPLATTELVFQLHNSSPIVQTDAVTVVFN